MCHFRFKTSGNLFSFSFEETCPETCLMSVVFLLSTLCCCCCCCCCWQQYEHIYWFCCGHRKSNGQYSRGTLYCFSFTPRAQRWPKGPNNCSPVQMFTLIFFHAQYQLWTYVQPNIDFDINSQYHIRRWLYHEHRYFQGKAIEENFGREGYLRNCGGLAPAICGHHSTLRGTRLMDLLHFLISHPHHTKPNHASPNHATQDQTKPKLTKRTTPLPTKLCHTRIYQTKPALG